MKGGYVALTIKTAMPEALLNRAAEMGVRFKRVEKLSPRELKAWVLAADEEKLKKMLEDLSIAYEVKERKGLSRGLEFVKRRFVLFAALVLSCAVLLAISDRVWIVEVSGAETADEIRIREALEENGIYTGRRKDGLDFMEIRRALEANMPEYAFFGVKTMGVTLMVNAVRAEDAPEVYRLKDVRDLIADSDGVILSVHAAAGHAAVKAGDTVKKGDVLIYGEEKVSAKGEVTRVRAEGSVIARIWTEGRAEMPLTRLDIRDTGKTAYESRLVMPYFDFVLSGENPFGSYREEMEYLPVVGMFIPVRIEKRVFRETEVTRVSEDTEQLKSALEARALAAARGKAPIGASEAKQWTEYETRGDKLCSRVVVEWTKEIARGG